MKPKVTLLSHTNDPKGTIYKVWEASKTNRPFDSINFDRLSDQGKVDEIFEKVIDSKIPCAENLDFVFLLEGVSISFREQMVRHRIGVKVGDRLGIDMVPDLADSSWWSQSMRILDMGHFAEDKAYREPNMTEGQAFIYETAMRHAQEAYKSLVSSGMSMEDAREVIPLGATHRISWKLNLAALMHIVGKRGCQILQGDLWEPIIVGMVNELADKVDPYFRRLIAPPCVKGGKYTGCLFKLDNERRVAGDDEIPPCTLYAGKETPSAYVEALYEKPRFKKMAEQYTRLWGRNALNYEPCAK